MADYLRKYKSKYSSTANSFGTGEAVTITPSSVVGLPTDTEIVLTFDRVASDGTTLTPAKEERIRGTITAGNFVVSASGRGYDGTTEQAHTSPVIEQIWNAADWNDNVVWGLVEHEQTGVHKAALVTTLKASAAEVTTGTNDTKIVTPKALRDSNPTFTSPTIDTTLKVRDVYDLGNLTGGITINPANGDRQGGVLTGNVTGITLTAPASNKKTVLTLMLGTGSGTFTIAWTTSVVWQDGATWGTNYYTTTASKLNVIVLYFDGTAWWGMSSKFA